MFETPPLKLFEGLLLLAALGLFVWWQFRDLDRARQQSREEAAARKTGGPADGTTPNDAPNDAPEKAP
jgi:predicted lipid-binding transport protein (Tim44 family)